MLAASEGDDWVYHRGRGTLRKPLDDITLRKLLDDITLRTADGIPYLTPEIVLLFESRSDRPKDTEDFEDVCELFDRPRRTWLRTG